MPTNDVVIILWNEILSPKAHGSPLEQMPVASPTAVCSRHEEQSEFSIQHDGLQACADLWLVFPSNPPKCFLEMLLSGAPTTVTWNEL